MSEPSKAEAQSGTLRTRESWSPSSIGLAIGAIVLAAAIVGLVYVNFVANDGETVGSGPTAPGSTAPSTHASAPQAEDDAARLAEYVSHTGDTAVRLQTELSNLDIFLGIPDVFEERLENLHHLAESELDWLAANPPSSCYADAFAAYRAGMAAMASFDPRAISIDERAEWNITMSHMADSMNLVQCD